MECLAALVAIHTQEVEHVAPGPNRHVYKILASATAPDRVEWHFNHTRAIHCLPKTYVELLPSGTTSNEALHAEIKSWTHNIKEIHIATLDLKLHVFSTFKALAWTAAACRPTFRAVRQAEVVAAATSRPLWTVGEWRAFCKEQHRCSDKPQGKADGRLAAARKVQASKVTQ